MGYGAILMLYWLPVQFVLRRPDLYRLPFYLALFGSVIAFGAYLTLLGQIGADRASYSSLLFPLVALGFSTLFEGYQWSVPALAGVVLVLAGNFLVLSRQRKKAPVSQAESQV
jgi:drug/metabolite transporter (DMT)-like permease